MIPLATAGLVGAAVDIARTVLGGNASASAAHGGARFEQLLDAATSAFGSSGFGVTVDPSVDVSLTSEQLDAIAKLTDDATEQGVARLLVQHGNQSYVVDVATRTIIAKVDANLAPPMRVDGFASLDNEETSDNALPTPVLGF